MFNNSPTNFPLLHKIVWKGIIHCVVGVKLAHLQLNASGYSPICDVTSFLGDNVCLHKGLRYLFIGTVLTSDLYLPVGVYVM